MSQSITLLRREDYSFLGKRFDADLKEKNTGVTFQWAHFSYEYKDASDLFEVLEAASKEGKFALIRGSIKAGLPKVIKRRHSNIDEVRLSWIALDLDGDANIPDLGPEQARADLPECFHAAACWWQRTASAGVKKGRRYRFVFALDAPVSNQDLKDRFYKGNKWSIDPCLFSKAQLTFLASPLFAVPSMDPYPGELRSGVLPGGALLQEEVLSIPVLVRARRVCHVPSSILMKFQPRLSRYYQAAVLNMIKDLMKEEVEGGRQMLLKTKMVRLAKIANGAGVPEQQLSLDLCKLAQASLKSRPGDEAEVSRLLEWTFNTIDDASYPAFLAKEIPNDEE